MPSHPCFWLSDRRPRFFFLDGTWTMDAAIYGSYRTSLLILRICSHDQRQFSFKRHVVYCVPSATPQMCTKLLAEWVDCKSVDPSKLYRTTCKILEGLEGIYICSVCQFRRVLAIWQFEERQPIIIKNVQYISYTLALLIDEMTGKLVNKPCHL